MCALAPIDQARKPSSRSICALKPISCCARSGGADAVAHERCLAARRVVDRLVGAGQIEQLFGYLLQRGPLAGADVVEAVASHPTFIAQMLARAQSSTATKSNASEPSPRIVGPSPRSIASSIFMITAM